MPMPPASPIKTTRRACRCATAALVVLGALTVLPPPASDAAEPTVPGQQVSGAALFDALTHAGSPGLAEELRSIAGLLDRAGAPPSGTPAGGLPTATQAANVSHAAAEASRRLTNAAARLDQAEASPTLVLANMADRLDAAMNGLAASHHPPDPLPARLLLLACALSVGAAVLGVGAVLFSRRTRPLPGADLGFAPDWAEALPDRVATMVRDVAASGPPASLSPHTTQALHAAMAAGAQLADAAQDAEARLQAATRRAEAALDDSHGTEGAVQHLIEGSIQRLEEQLSQLCGRLLGDGAEQLAGAAHRLDGAAAPIAALSAQVEQAAFRMDHASERLEEAIPALDALLDGTLPAAVSQITALGDKLDAQTATADAAARWLAYVAEISARLEATTQALSDAGAGLPARVEQAANMLQAAAFRAAAAVVGEAERTAGFWEGTAAPFIQQMGQTSQAMTLSGRALDAVAARLETSGEALAGLGRMLPTRAEQTAGLLAAASERAVAMVVGEVERAAAAWSRRAAPIAQHMSEASEQVTRAGQALDAVAARLDATGVTLGDLGQALPARAGQAVGHLEAAADRLAAAAEAEATRAEQTADALAAAADHAAAAANAVAERAAARAAATAEALQTAAEQAATAIAGEAERAATRSAQAAAELQAAAERTAGEADRAAATWHDGAGAVAAEMQAASHQVAEAGQALQAILTRLETTGQAVEAATAALPAQLGRAADGLLAHAGEVSETIAAGLGQATSAFVETAGSTVRLLSEIGEQLLRTGQQVEALGSRVGDGCEDRLQQIGDGLEARIDAAGAEVARVIALLAEDLERQVQAAPPAGPDGPPPPAPPQFGPDGEALPGLARHAPDLLAGVQATVGRLQSVATALAEACDRQATQTRRRAR